MADEAAARRKRPEALVQTSRSTLRRPTTEVGWLEVSFEGRGERMEESEESLYVGRMEGSSPATSSLRAQ